MKEVSGMLDAKSLGIAGYGPPAKVLVAADSPYIRLTVDNGAVGLTVEQARFLARQLRRLAIAVDAEGG